MTLSRILPEGVTASFFITVVTGQSKRHILGQMAQLIICIIFSWVILFTPQSDFTGIHYIIRVQGFLHGF